MPRSVDSISSIALSSRSFPFVLMPTWANNNSSLKQNIYLVYNTIYDCSFGARFQTTAIDNILLRNPVSRSDCEGTGPVFDQERNPRFSYEKAYIDRLAGFGLVTPARTGKHGN